MKISRADSPAAARAALRRTLAPLGPAAQDALDAPACADAVAEFVSAAWALTDATDDFRGTAPDALALEQAAKDYRAALRGLQDAVAAVLMRHVVPVGGTH